MRPSYVGAPEPPKPRGLERVRPGAGTGRRPSRLGGREPWAQTALVDTRRSEGVHAAQSHTRERSQRTPRRSAEVTPA